MLLILENVGIRYQKIWLKIFGNLSRLRILSYGSQYCFYARFPDKFCQILKILDIFRDRIDLNHTPTPDSNLKRNLDADFVV